MEATAEKMTLRQWRLVKGYRVNELAGEAGITERTLNNYEASVSALRNASYARLESMAKVLGIRVDDIFLSPSSEKPKYAKED